jgi:hypothetical protein
MHMLTHHVAATPSSAAYSPPLHEGAIIVTVLYDYSTGS